MHPETSPAALAAFVVRFPKTESRAFPGGRLLVIADSPQDARAQGVRLLRMQGIAVLARQLVIESADLSRELGAA